MILPELLQLSGNYWSTCTLHAGVKLDVFTHLADGPLSVSQLARIIHADERGLDMLLNALTAMDLLQKEEDAFRATPFSADYLSKTSDNYMGHIIMHHQNLVEGWSRLDEAVKSGAPVRRRSSHEAGRRGTGKLSDGHVQPGLPPGPPRCVEDRPGGRRRLLDLAGGPGTYAIHFCKQNPDLTAVIFDLPTTRPFAEQTVGRFGLSGRIAFSGGDITSDDIGTDYDVVWVSHLLHSEGPESSAAIVAKAAAALKTGGLLLIQEFILDDNRAAPLHPALFSLNMLVGTPAGQAYSQGELHDMMKSAGLGEIRRLEIDLPNGAGIMAGTR